MSRHWIRAQTSATASAVPTQTGAGGTIYHNSRETVTNIVLIQEATIVATHLYLVSNTEDLFTVRLLVVDENVTPTVSMFEEEDPQYKGIYAAARGPTLYSPRRKISIPTEHQLFMQVIKETGSTSSTIGIYYQFLINLKF